MDTIGERLKKIRKLRGWTQSAVSQKAHINAALYRQYECGDRTPKLEALVKIAGALEVDVAFLQPTRTDTPMSTLALIFDLLEEYGDIVFQNKGGTVMFGIDHFAHSSENLKLSAAMNAHKGLTPEAFKQWLMNYPSLIHNEKLVEK